MTLLAVLYLSLVTYLAPTTPAQDRTLTGTWLLSADAVSGETGDGGTWTRTAVKGTLDIEEHDGTLKGTWKGPAGAAWTLTGRIEGGKFEILTETRSLPVTRDGEQSTATVRWTFRGSAAGDTMKGTMALGRGDDGEEHLQPFSGKRR